MTTYCVQAQPGVGEGIREWLSAPDAGSALVAFAKRNPFRHDRTAHYYVEEAQWR